MIPRFVRCVSLLVIACTVASPTRAQEMPSLQKEEGDFIARDFRIPFGGGAPRAQAPLHHDWPTCL